MVLAIIAVALILPFFIFPVIMSLLDVRAVNRLDNAYPKKVFHTLHHGSVDPRRWRMKYIHICSQDKKPFSGRIGFTLFGKVWFFGNFDSEGEDIYLHTFFGRGSTYFCIHILESENDDIVVEHMDAIASNRFGHAKFIEFPPTILQRLGL